MTHQAAPKQLREAIRSGHFDGVFYMPLKAMDKMGIRVNTATGRKGIDERIIDKPDAHLRGQDSKWCPNGESRENQQSRNYGQS